MSPSANASPTLRPPCTRFNTPGGKPASSNSRTRSSPHAGVNSLGLKTTVLPISNAGTMWPFARCIGKLNGPSTASTPSGLCRVAAVVPLRSKLKSLRRARIASTVASTLPATAAASVLASHSGLPASSAIRSAISPAWCRATSAYL